MTTVTGHLPRHAVLFATTVLLAVMLVPTAGAAEPPTVVGPTSVLEGVDHATTVIRDPWDYTEQTDVITDTSQVSVNVVSSEVSDGLLVFETEPTDDGGTIAYHELHYTNVQGALIDGHGNTVRHPIDADRLDHVTMRIHSEQFLSNARLAWYGCHQVEFECVGAESFQLREGWQTVTLRLDRNKVANYTRDWEGDVVGLRLEVIPDTSVEVRLDWLRVHAAPTTIDVTTDASVVYWDLDTDPPTGNESQDREDRSVGRLSVENGTAAFPVDVFPPGTYHLWTADDGYGDTITIRPRPRPVVLDPDLAGGVDFATEMLGNPWDFDSPADAVRVCNATDVAWLDQVIDVTGEVANGVLALTNGEFDCSSSTQDPRPGITNDPYVQLAVGDGLDPLHYHRVTVDTWFDRGFDLKDDDGGGAHGRFIWRSPTSHPAPADPRYFQDGREMVYYTNRTVYSYDMLDTYSGPASEPGDEDWGVSTITNLRYDPNEDTGARRSFIDELRIAADDAATPTFDIRVRDNLAAAGSTYRLGVDTDRSGYDGEVLVDGESLPRAGATVTWDATDLLPGPRWVWFEVTTADGDTARTYAEAVLQVGPRISGPDRIATAVALSSQRFAAADAAVVATASDFPDALAAVQLAAAVGGPLLLTDKDDLDGRVVAELRRLDVTDVYVAGGPGAVSESVVDALRDVGDVTRLGGEDRYDTAALLARRARRLLSSPDPQRVLVALGTNFPDALAASPLVAAGDVPLVLVGGAGPVASATRDQLAAWSPDEILVTGGPVAVSDEVVAELATIADVTRIAGDNRYDTAARLHDLAVDAGARRSRVLVATGESFPDALGAGAALAADGGVLVLTHPTHVPDASADILDAADATSLRVLGGPRAVWHVVVREVVLRAT